jgi:thiamine monophosphate synthase
MNQFLFCCCMGAIQMIRAFSSSSSSSLSPWCFSSTTATRSYNNRRRQQQQRVFPESEPPFLALITLGTSCDSDTDLHNALQSLHAAVSTGLVDLVSVRIDADTAFTTEHPHDTREQQQQQQRRRQHNPKELRLISMIQNLLSWSQQYNGFRVVISSDWVDLGIQVGVHGVHWKEKHVHRIPTITTTTTTKLLMGISTHNTSFAIEAWEKYQPDYIFAGTCFATESHPDKTQLEGPSFPAKVVKAFIDREQHTDPYRRRPKVLAIGGIDATNCRDVTMPGRYVAEGCSVSTGACPDGIATIRAILQAHDPGAEVHKIKQNMKHF